MKYMKIAAALLVFCIFLGLGAAFTPEADAADETYEMSEQYKRSKYYENFKEISLSGDQKSDVIAIALSQLGYHEGNSDADLDGMNLSGNRDFVEYNVLYGALDNSQGNGVSYGYYWCASFVNWCLRQAKVSKEASAAAEVSCQRWMKKCREADIFHDKKDYIPTEGDLIFFKDKGSQVVATHMGIVLYCADGIVYTIEGNTSNDNSFSSDGNYVALKSYELESTYIAGYATPDYETKQVKRVDRAPYSMSPGAYISKDKIDLYKSGDGKEKVATVDEHDIFTVTEICADGFKITYEKSGKVYTGYADIEEKAVQMTASDGEYRTVDFLSEGKKIFNTYYLLEGTETRTPDARPEKEGAGFVTWVEVTDPTVSSMQKTLSAGDKIQYYRKNTVFAALWDTSVYTVTFVDDRGHTVKEIKGYFGEKIEPPETVELPEGIYFEGWGVDKLPETITGSVIYTAEIRDETPWGRFVESSPITVGLTLSVAFLVLGVVMLILLYRKKPE